jgi:hypothetical protein
MNVSRYQPNLLRPVSKKQGFSPTPRKKTELGLYRSRNHESNSDDNSSSATKRGGGRENSERIVRFF